MEILQKKEIFRSRRVVLSTLGKLWISYTSRTLLLEKIEISCSRKIDIHDEQVGQNNILDYLFRMILVSKFYTRFSLLLLKMEFLHFTLGSNDSCDTPHFRLGALLTVYDLEAGPGQQLCFTSD